MLKCPYCGTSLNKLNYYCPGCKKSVYYHINPDSERKYSKKEQVAWIILGVLCPIFCLVLFFFWYKKEKEKTKENPLYMLVGSLINIGYSALSIIMPILVSFSVITYRSTYYEEYKKIPSSYDYFDDASYELFLKKSQIGGDSIEIIFYKTCSYYSLPSPYEDLVDKNYAYTKTYIYEGEAIYNGDEYIMTYSSYKVEFDFKSGTPRFYKKLALTYYTSFQQMKLMSGGSIRYNNKYERSISFSFDDENKIYSFSF